MMIPWPYVTSNIVTPRMGCVSRNLGFPAGKDNLQPVTPRMGCVSRNPKLRAINPSIPVTPRMGCVSRNGLYPPLALTAKSHPAWGV